MDQKQLREQENRCIQEQPPACTAACPAHVDARGMIAEINRGDYNAALKLYRKAVPFPGIISRICDQPCQAVCLRKDLGGSIEIAALERACLAFGGQNIEPVKALPRKAKKVAIIGAGISGLTVAFDLARKGWGVVIYEASDRIGGSLWKTPPDLLPRNVLVEDLQVIEDLGVEIRLNTAVGRRGGNGHSTFLARLCDEYDAVYLSIGPNAGDLPDLKLDASGKVAVDPQTLHTSLEGVFAGGDVLRVSVNYPEQELKHSSILSISDGRRAATSIDRYLQRVSLTASRTNEGPYETRLYTNTRGIAAQPPPDQYTLYSREVAETEAARCIQCECLECVKSCAYLEHYKGYPKKYMREIYNNLSIVMGTRYSNQLINTCALCGLCSEVCPTDVDMGEICREARGMMVEQKRMPSSAHEFALPDMAFSNGEKAALARSAPGEVTSTYAFFPGCQLSGTSAHHVEKAYAFLRGAFQGEGVGLMLRCCGAPADWAARKDVFAAVQAEFYAEYEKLGRPTLVLACSSCYQVFQKHYPDIRIVSFWEIYDQYGPQAFVSPPIDPPHPPVAIHDPCSTRYEARIQDAVRNIVSKLGRSVEEMPFSREKTECCSYGGLMWLANRPVAEKMVDRRIGESPLDYVTYCAMCRDFFARRGKRTLHLLDLIYGEPGADPATAPAVGFSQRHENRARLKAHLLNELWSEAVPQQQSFEAIRLILPELVEQMVEERLILVEDMQKVIEAAERTGKRMFNPANGHYLAYLKPASVTYWVEYTPQEGAYRVHKAYSHRMEIGLGGPK